MNDKEIMSAAPRGSTTGTHRSLSKGRKPAGARPPADETATEFDASLSAYARALGHPARVAIVRMLIQGGECVCGDLVSRLPLAQATVSQHLKVLKEAGLIRGTIDPPRVCYCIDPEAVRKLQSLVAALGADVPHVDRIG
jgi:ArsR family transcriptional regulator